MSSPESLDLQARFVQQIALEFIHIDGYNRCLDQWYSIGGTRRHLRGYV